MAPLITLTTDFGSRDSYVAQLKGVLVSEGPPDLRIVDLSHEVSPFNVHEAALFLRAAVPRFPAGTVHLVVVDPGVGSDRPALIVEVQGQTLVGPDNHVFGYLYDGREQVYAIDPVRLGERRICSTFHGRDLFAPIAARLSGGAEPGALGTRVDSYQHLVFPLVELSGDSLHGRVVHIDRYGNLVTNIPESTLRGFLADGAERALVFVGDRSIRGLVSHYAEGRSGQLLALIGSSGLLEVAAREADAATKLGVEVGRPVRIQRGH